MRIHSIRFKANVLYSLILGGILLVYSGILFYGVRGILYRDLDENLRVKANEVGGILNAYEQIEKIENRSLSFLQEFLSDGHLPPNKTVIDDLWRSEVKTLNLKNDYIHILTFNGYLVLASENVHKDEEALFAREFPFVGNKIVFKDLKDKDHHLRVVNFPLLRNNRLWLIIQIGTPLSSIIHTLGKLKIFILFTIILALLLTSFIGGVFAKDILTPVKQITEAADRISYKDLHVRVEEKQTDEEIRGLVKSFNTMLSRLEKSFGHINEFSSHVAHELKTPLAILRGEMELALIESRGVEEYRKALEIGMEEVNRLIKIVKDILLLANLDYRTDIFKFEKINLVEFVKDICENGKILAMGKNVTVTCGISLAGLYVDGDKTHLRRLFFNLINNAVKFTPAGGKIHITVKEHGKKAFIAVEDTGIGIAKEDLNKVFTKFFRGSKEQKNLEFGSGLGLSIAQSIAAAHQGAIAVESQENKGSVFTVTLPLL